MRLSDRAIVNEVFRDQSLSLNQWTQVSEFPTVTLFVYICLKFVISILPCGSPLSIGVFGPLFTIGAAIGRLYGETLMKYWKPSQSPATYAVVGAACFASSATQTVSTSVIFFELTGQLSHMVPVMIASVVAYFVSGVIAPSIYDILAEWAGLHAVCYDFNEHIMNQKYAENNMISVTTAFTRETTYTQALQALVWYEVTQFLMTQYLSCCDYSFRIEHIQVRRVFSNCKWPWELPADCKSTLYHVLSGFDSFNFINWQGCIRRFDLEVAIARFHAIHNHQVIDVSIGRYTQCPYNFCCQILDTDQHTSERFRQDSKTRIRNTGFW